MSNRSALYNEAVSEFYLKIMIDDEIGLFVHFPIVDGLLNINKFTVKCDVGRFWKLVVAGMVILGPCSGFLYGESDEASKIAPDFKLGFEKLITVGVPSTEGARYGKLELHDEKSQNYNYQEFKLKRKGSGWILPVVDGAEKDRVAIQNGWQTIDVHLAKKKGLLGTLFGSSSKKKVEGAVNATWKEMDPLAEAKSFMSQIEKWQTEGQVFSEDNWRYRSGGREIGAEVLLFACHLYHAGHVEPANELAIKILEIVPEPASLIDHIITKIADERMGEALKNLYQDHDWKGYLASLKALKKDFPRGWQTFEGLEILIPQVERRVSGDRPKMTPVSGTELNPEIVKILDQLVVSKEPLVLQFYPLWLINPVGEIQPRYGRSVSAPWALDILKAGMSGLPTLIAYCSDETLLTGSPQEMRYRGRYRYSSYSSDELDAFQVYQNMDRPKTRGEVVRQLLMATIPDPDREFSSLDPEDFKAIAIDWWKTHHKSDPGALAAQFLEGRDHEATQVASQFLILSEKDEDHQRLESFILNSEYIIRHTDLAESYVKKRKAKAKPFFETFSKEILALDEEELSGQKPEFILRQLSIHVEEVRADSIIKDIISGKRDLKEALTQLASIIPEGEKNAALSDILAMAMQMKKAEEQLLILQTLMKWSGAEYRLAKSKDEDQEQKYIEDLFSQLSKSREDWRKLITTRQPLNLTSEQKATFGGPPSLSHYAAWCLNSIYLPAYQNDLQSLSYMMKQHELWAFYLKTGQEILDKGDEVSIPSASQVDEARKEEIRAHLRTMEVMEIFPYLRSLNLSEQLAWNEIVSGYAENIPEGVKEFSMLCGSVIIPFGANIDEKLEERLYEEFLGKRVQAELIHQGLEVLKSMTGGEKDFALFFSAGRSGVGNFLLQAWVPDYFKDWKKRELEEEFAQLSSEGASSLQAVIVYGLEDNRDSKKAVLYQKPIDAKAEEAAMAELLSEVMDALRDNQKEADPKKKKQLSIILLHHDLADSKAETEEE